MGKVYNAYINNEDHTWYDSSNIVYSVCFDNQKDTPKNIKIVFKGGRTYLYKDVDPADYIQFRESDSQGTIFNKVIKKYECIKQDDVDLNKLNEMMDHFKSLNQRTTYNISMKLNDTTGEFVVMINDEPVFQSVEEHVSIVNLFKAMGIDYSYCIDNDYHNKTDDDFINAEIINNIK